jgi:hypothetical protein
MLKKKNRRIKKLLQIKKRNKINLKKKIGLGGTPRINKTNELFVSVIFWVLKEKEK